MKKLLVLALSFVLCICSAFAVACGGSAEGVYKFKSVTIGQSTYEVGDVAPWDYKVLTTESFTLELKTDGTVISSTIRAGQTRTQNGTWTLDGKTLSLTFEGFVQTATLKNGVITLAESGDSQSVVYVYEKA